MAAVCPDFKWMGLWISDPIRNLDHFQPDLCSTIQNPDLVGIQMVAVFKKG